jgi:hypothetical protein
MYMENKQFCQSCSMPLDKPKVLGTEKDGSKSKEYCMYCYKDGAFTNPGISLDTMRKHVKKQMQNMKMDAPTIAWVESTLPYLKRWKANTGATQ